MHIRDELFNEIRELYAGDKKDAPNQEMLFRRLRKIHIPKTPNGLAEMDLRIMGMGKLPPHTKDTFSMYSPTAFIWDKEKAGGAADKVAHLVLTNWVIFLGGRRYNFGR